MTSAERLAPARQLDGAADVIVNACRRVPGAASDADFDHTMHANVLAPMRVLPQLADMLAPGAKLALISSKMGSMGARNATSSWLYRASKAAANSVLKDISLEWAGKAVRGASTPAGCAPTWAAPAQTSASKSSVAGMRRVIASLAAQGQRPFPELRRQRDPLVRTRTCC